MKKLILALAMVISLFFVSGTEVRAQLLDPRVSTMIAVGFVDFFGYEAITVDATVGGVPLTPSKFLDAKLAFCTLENASIRFTVDGVTTPTASVGHPAGFDTAGYSMNFWLLGGQISKFKAIRTGTTSGDLRCSYGK